jgi:putative SOS response-associated peptidase YedK
VCNRYRPASKDAIEAQWQLKPRKLWKPDIGPWGNGPFIRLVNNEPELVTGQWALIGDSDIKANSKPRMTNNARVESIDKLRTFKGPWARGQRCVIPAESYDEPNWESGSNVWWSMRCADGQPWHLAGLWNAWTDKSTGEIHESYTMVTMNCDAHPLLRRMHKPDPFLPPDQQDKRSVIPFEIQDLRTWLSGTIDEALPLIRLPAVEVFAAGAG